jgi:hypothetical protein
MTVRTKIEIALLGLVLSASGLLLRSWLEAHDERTRLQAILDAQKTVIRQVQQQIQTLANDEKQRDAQAQSAIATMRRDLAGIQTPKQIASWIPSQLPTPSPITLTVPAASPSNPKPDAVAQIPPQDLPSIRDAIESCKECTLELQTAQQNISSKNQQIQLAGEQLSAVGRQRDAAIAAAKGGTFWHRLRQQTKWLLLGAGAAAASLCTSGHCR